MRFRRNGLDALLLSLTLFVATAASANEGEIPCDPIEAPRVYAQLAPSGEPGMRPSRNRGSAAVASGPIITLPHSDPDYTPQQIGGEALLVLPKRADGSLPTGYELAQGVNVVSSFWSPVLCSTLTRLSGNSDLSPSQFVSNLPSDASLVPNHIYATASTTLLEAVIDPYRELQHGLDRLGVDAAVSVSAGGGAKVAVLDSAPDVRHRDLAGIRVFSVDGGPGTEPAVHGSLTAGVIAAVAGNGYGIAGAAPGAEVFAVAVCAPLGESGRDSCKLYDLLRGIDVAIAEGAQVINLSFVGPSNPLLRRAVKRLDQLGVVAVAAAGNEGTDEPRYPAAYPNVVGVGATDAEGRPFPLSNRGLSAEIWAPGAEVLSTVPGDAFAFASGTSFAAAHVSGALAVLIGGGASPEQARRALFHAAQSRGNSAPAVAPLCDALARLGSACTQ